MSSYCFPSHYKTFFSSRRKSNYVKDTRESLHVDFDFTSKSKSHFRWSFLSTAAAFFPQSIISKSHVLTMNWKCKRFLQGSTPTFLRSERESGADYPKRFYVMTHRNGISKRGVRFDSFFHSQCLKLAQNVSFEFLNFGIFRQFLFYWNWHVW